MFGFEYKGSKDDITVYYINNNERIGHILIWEDDFMVQGTVITFILYKDKINLSNYEYLQLKKELEELIDKSFIDELIGKENMRFSINTSFDSSHYNEHNIYKI